MKQLLFFLVLSIHLLTGCVKQNAIFGKNSPVNLDEQLEEKKGLWFIVGEGELYTGDVFSNYESGTLAVQGSIVNGVPQGKWTYWHENGQKKSEGNILYGTEEGLWVSWYENGEKKVEGSVNNGQIEGMWMYWYEDGSRKAVRNFKNGREHGFWQSWYENGQVSGSGNTFFGKQDGTWTKWDEDGNKILEQVYEKGQLIKEENTSSEIPDESEEQ